MTFFSPPHLWLALSPHGFGHAAMTAPVIAQLRRRLPSLRLTIQTGPSVPRDFLESRYGTDFILVHEIPDFGLSMLSATKIDEAASAKRYQSLHAHWPLVVAAEAERLRQAAPDLVLANVPYVTMAAAAKAKIRVVGFSSLQWLDIYRQYLGHRPEAAEIIGQMAAAYNSAATFLRVTPAMEMPSLTNIQDIGPVGSCGMTRKAELRRALNAGEGEKIGLIAFGGIDHDLDLSRWPRLEGWTWLSTLPCPPGREDLRPWKSAGFSYADMAASVEVIITKPGYGTFVEAAMAGIPVLYQTRLDWPECPHLDNWLKKNGRGMEIQVEELLAGGLPEKLQKLFSLCVPRLAEASGNVEAASVLQTLLEKPRSICECS